MNLDKVLKTLGNVQTFKITGAAGSNILYKLERVELFELPGGGGEDISVVF